MWVADQGVREGQQPSWIVPEGLWGRVVPLLPKRERRLRYPGCKPVEDRRALCGIRFVLHTGIPCGFLPLEWGFGAGMSCWRQRVDWQVAGVWDRLHLLLAELQAADKLD